MTDEFVPASPAIQEQLQRGAAIHVTAVLARDAFALAERVAPRPDSRDVPASDWARHHAALALAAHGVAREAVAGLPPNPGKGSRPDLGYLTALAVSSTAAAAALLGDPAEISKLLWELTPEAGNLNGEDVDWLADNLDGLGVNPADLYRWFDAADFNSPSAAVTA
ncbi:hypothetical protein [Phytohabitans houttuyneae]|uniref:Uncharacterized protein n=1 Tax=Phytohabitans houttuyneae TaxID=1076126 RepID=A0A6V8KCV1_9ACTN|nr:hypothetical protein [Phytohabitans houttuyneae]GFJ79517.1 hypothetical protein Phou_036970 [Phytohabitans houttuyneae]